MDPSLTGSWECHRTSIPRFLLGLRVGHICTTSLMHTSDLIRHPQSDHWRKSRRDIRSGFNVPLRYWKGQSERIQENL
jgi:hypothetical protein